MSSTRYAAPGKPFRQERFASAPEFERGLLANLVALRCSVLQDQRERDLIWFLQYLANEPGGLKKTAAELTTMFPERLGTPSMLRFGMKPGQIYDARQVRAVRDELPVSQEDLLEELAESAIDGFGNKASEDLHFKTGWMERFPLSGEGFQAARHQQCNGRALALLQERSRKLPQTYPAANFVEIVREAARELDELLKRLCLDPAMTLANCAPWYFPALAASLHEYQAAWIEAQRARVVVTSLGQKIYDALDFALENRTLVLIDGLARTGKTFAVKAWCLQHPGQARYAQVPSTNDDIGFFRSIAKSLGVSVNRNYKAQELRARIEDVLQSGDLLLCLDEAHYCWPQSNYRAALPGRINWIMTACANYGVPVALITTPQFLRAQKVIEARTCWTSEQLLGRIKHYEKLPDTISQEDLAAVAKSLLPEGDNKAIEALVLYATASAKYLSAIESAVLRARYDAQKAGRSQITTRDIKRVINGSVMSSDSTLALALEGASGGGRDRGRKARSRVFQVPRTPLAVDAENCAVARNNFAANEPAAPEKEASSTVRNHWRELLPA